MRSAVTAPMRAGENGPASSSAVARASAASQFPSSQLHTVSANRQNGSASSGAAWLQAFRAWARSERARLNLPNTEWQTDDAVSAHTMAVGSFPAASRCWASATRQSLTRPSRMAVCAAWPRAATRDTGRSDPSTSADR